MSRRASLFAKEQAAKGKDRPRVHFPDDLIFLENVKDNDTEAMQHMLRRVSAHIDLNAMTNTGMTPLHLAVLNGNFSAVRMLIKHGADVNKQDDDSWTPLHAACAEGHDGIARYLIKKGADKTILTDDRERPIDLVDPRDLPTITVMLQ